MVQTQNWLEDSSKGNGEQVGVGIYSSQYLLDQVLDPVMIMKGVWKELIPRINKLLQFNEPLQFGSNDDGERAYCAAWNKDHAKSAFRGPGFYLSSTCLHWFDLQEQPGEFASWRNVMTCATEFWPKPNPHPPHLTGWVKDASIFDKRSCQRQSSSEVVLSSWQDCVYSYADAPMSNCCSGSRC
jgi:hypothetical protein